MHSPKIMVLRSDRLGDVVLCSGYLHSLVESRAEGCVDLWLAPDMEPCGQVLHPGLRVRSLPFDRHLGCEDEVLRRWLKEVEAEGYQELIVPQFTLGYAEILALSYLPIPVRWGFVNHEFGVLPDFVLGRLGAPANRQAEWIVAGPKVVPYSHEVSKYQALAEAQSFRCSGVQPRLHVSGLPQPVPGAGVLIWPGCGDEFRRWPAANFARVALELGSRDVAIGTTEAEQPIADTLQRELGLLGISGTIHLRRTSELAATARWLAGFEWLLTNDTGIAHLAAAAGCRVTSVSGSQHQGRFLAHGPAALTVFADVPCRQCSGLCIFDAAPYPCVSDIDPVAVAVGVRTGEAGQRLAPAPLFRDEQRLFASLLRARRSAEHSRRMERFQASSSVHALRRTLQEAERQRDEWRGRAQQAESQLNRSEALCKEAEAQRDQWKALCEETQQQRDRWEGLCHGAEQEQGRWKQLCRQAEQQEERSRQACREAESQRDRWERLCHEAEEQREQWKGLCREAEGQRDHWEQLCHQAEEQREHWGSRCVEAEGWVEHFYRHFPWARSAACAEKESLPKISIITPSFQQGDYIEQTIQSVLAQEYPNFEHIIVDAESTDQTIEILKRYPHVRWVSEPDQGQAHAINKGLQMATGDIVAYLNSDDVYRAGAFLAVARFFQQHPETRIVAGDCDYINAASETTGHLTAKCDSLEDLIRYWGWDRWYCIPQQSVFMRKELLAEVGLFDISLEMVMDYDMWLRVAQRTRIQVCPQTLAGFRLAANSKTTSRAHRMYYEEFSTSRKCWKLLPPARRLAVGLAAHHHLSSKLLDVAEHYAFEHLHPQLAPALLLSSARYWPLTALSPRFLLTGLQLAAARLRGKAAARRLHRYYLDLKWRLQNAIESVRAGRSR
jgi:GT2 family glycosyltransferase/ADP-heptose:LPS heptosyltransferase